MRYSVWIVGLLVVSALMLPGGVAAHSELSSSTPRDGAVLDTVPTTISAVFTEEFDLAGSALTAEDASGQRVDQDDAKLDPADTSEKTMLVSLKSGLGAGTYTVRWTTLSADGDTAEGSFSFSVASAGATASPGAAAASPAPAAAGTASDDASEDTATVLPATGSHTSAYGWLALTALVLCGSGLLLRLRRAPRS